MRNIFAKLFRLWGSTPDEESTSGEAESVSLVSYEKDKPSIEEDQLFVEEDKPSIKEVQPSSEVGQPSSEVDPPSSEVGQLFSEVGRPSREVGQPSSEVGRPSSEGPPSIEGAIFPSAENIENISTALSCSVFNILDCHRQVFGSVAASIGNHPKCYMVLITLFALLWSSFNIFIQFNDDFRSGYSILDKSSEREYAIFEEFANITAQPSTLVLIGESVDGGSMLRKEQYRMMRDEIAYGLSIEINCTCLKPNSTELQILRLRDRMLFADDIEFNVLDAVVKSKDFRQNMTYPFTWFHGQEIMMARNIYGFKKGFVHTLAFTFSVRGDDPHLENIRKAEVQWSERLKANENNLTRLRLLGDAVVNKEISDGAFGAFFYFVAGSGCMLLVVFLAIYCYHPKVLHAVFLTFWTIICPLLAGTCAMGFLSLIGVSVNCVMLITPFLVLAVGVDDAFLTMHHWFHSEETIPSRRLHTVLVPIGPSLTLTSFTNIAAFLIGSLLSAPDLRLFCYSTALAFFLDWALQLFLFSPAMLFVNEQHEDLPVVRRERDNKFAVSYCQWLQKPRIKVFLSGIILTYWAISMYGAISMKENFSPQKTFDSNSFLAKALAHYEEAFNDHEVIRVFINEFPDTVGEFRKDLESFHSIPYLCKNFPSWFEIFEKAYPFDNQTTMNEYFAKIQLFVSERPYYLQYTQFKKTKNILGPLKRLAFDVCVYGHGTWHDRALILDDLRMKLPQGYSVYVAESTVLALITSSRSSVFKSVVITIFCMAVICLVFVPSIRAAGGAIISVASITIGVIGGLYYLGADLDTLVLVNVVMAIGMTVDFSAHISYHCFFETTDGSNPEKIADAIQAVAVPTALAALTTFACVFPLYFYSVYIYVTFAKTILLIASLGLLHTVFVVPFIISLL